MKRKIIAIIVLGLVLLASLLACGYFGAKTIHRSHQRRAAMAAYEKKDYMTAERLLRQYIAKDQNSEPEFVALANIYHEFGNTGYEAQMWHRAYSLNPLNAEYREKTLASAIRSANYGLIYSFLGGEVKSGSTLPEQELSFYILSSYRTGHSKEGVDAYKKAVKNDPEAFHKSELGRMVEFMTNYSSLSEKDREDFLSEARRSEDPVIRFEALYTDLMRARESEADGADVSDRMEDVLKTIVETNYYVGTPLLADFYYSEYRFPEVMSVSESYLKTIDDLNLYLLCAESCFFNDQLDELKALEGKLRKKTGSLSLLADYCEILIAYLEEDEAKLFSAVHKSGKLVSSPLSRFIRLRVALTQDSFSEVLSAAKEIFSGSPFVDLQDRAVLACLDYLSEQMRKKENQDDPTQMAELANLMASRLQGNRLLTEIVVAARYKKGLATESELMEALERFPDDLLLLEITAEYLIFNGKSDMALPLLEQVTELETDGERLDFLRMLAQDQQGHHDQAAEIFRSLVENSSFDLDLLADYLDYCWKHDRRADLRSMAEKIENATDENLKAYADYFQAALLLLEDDDAKTAEALKLLAATPNDKQSFTFFAANRLNEADMLEEAEAKYNALVKTYPTPGLILVNLSEVYVAKGDSQKALAAAKEAYDIEKNSILPAFIYAQRLSEAERYEEAVAVLRFPRHAVNYREDVVDLWTECMKKTIEKNIADRKYTLAEENCKHLLVIVPGDEFGQAKLEEVRKLMRPKINQEKEEKAAEAAAS